MPFSTLILLIIESVDSISRDGPDCPYRVHVVIMRHGYIFAHNMNRKQSPELIFYLHNLQPTKYTSYTSHPLSLYASHKTIKKCHQAFRKELWDEALDMRHNYIFAHNINRKQSPELIFYLHNLQPVEYTSYTFYLPQFPVSHKNN